MPEITDPAILAQLNGQVTDPNLLAQLNGTAVDMNQPVPDVWAKQGKWHTPWGSTYNVPQWLDQAMSGAGRGLIHTGRSVANLAGLLPDSVLKDEAQYDKPLLSHGAAQAGNILGEAAATAPLGMAATAGLGAVAPALGGGIIDSALQGGIQGLATADPGQRLSQTAAGALTGGSLSAGGKILGKAMRGFARTPAAQRLIEEGIQLTPGQMNPSGVFNQFEQAAESIPGAKQVIEPARENAERQMQALIVSKGAAPGAKITPSGNIPDMLQQAQDSYAPLYDQAKGFPVTPKIMRVAGGDIPLSDAMQGAAKAPGVPGSISRSENNWLQDRLTQLPQNPDSSDLIQLRSDIRERARTFNLKTDSTSEHIAGINDRAEHAVTQALQSQLPQDALDSLNAADSNYGNYKIVENAVARSKDNLVGLSPSKLSQAIAASVPQGSYARGGGGPLRQLAQDAGEVFQNVSPPTGARVLTLGAGALGALHPSVGIPMAATMLGTIGTDTGRRFAAGVTGPQVAAQRLAKAISANVPQYARTAAGQIGKRAATQALMPVGAAASPAALAAALLATKNLAKESGVSGGE